MYQKSFAIDQTVDWELVIDRSYEISNAFREEQSMRIAIPAIGLKPINGRYRRGGFKLPKVASAVILHPP
jgi:hypothetical protein